MALGKSRKLSSVDLQDKRNKKSWETLLRNVGWEGTASAPADCDKSHLDSGGGGKGLETT